VFHTVLGVLFITLSYCPNANIVFLTLGCQTPSNSMLCSGCVERTHNPIHMYLFLAKPRTLTRLSSVTRSAGTVERIHAAPASSAMTARIHTAGLQHLNSMKFNCISNVTCLKLDIEEFRFENAIFRCLCPQFVSKIESKLFSVVYNVLTKLQMFGLKCQQMAQGFNVIDIIKHRNVQSTIP
jgi:hypothetical protein